MKRNILQIITGALCVILLVIVIIQGIKLNDLSIRLDNSINYMQSDLQNQISNLTNNFKSELKELDSIVAYYEFKPMGINKDTKTLLANTTLQLKEWNENTEVSLHLSIGTEKLSVAATSDGSGMFSAVVELPCKNTGTNEIRLDAVISNGEVTKQESLGAWGDISMLLPLQNNGGGWSGPSYENGIMQSRFDISISGLNAEPSVVNNPEFWIYKNGEIEQKLEAIPSEENAFNAKDYTVNIDNNGWSITCEEGDLIEIRFRCEDE